MFADPKVAENSILANKLILVGPGFVKMVQVIKATPSVIVDQNPVIGLKNAMQPKTINLNPWVCITNCVMNRSGTPSCNLNYILRNIFRIHWAVAGKLKAVNTDYITILHYSKIKINIVKSKRKKREKITGRL